MDRVLIMHKSRWDFILFITSLLCGYLDLSHNDLNVDGLKTIGRFLVEHNCRNLRVLKLSSISHFAYISDDFTE